jgi:UDP-2,3-diacylglucosamine pyrophosphatase LpxH
MRNLLRYLLLRPILWLVARFESAPNRERIFDALTKLREEVKSKPGKKGFTIPLDSTTGRFIIFSDQHKGGKNGADDFMLAESNYLAALEYYNSQAFHLICLGDCEELWENTLVQVKKNNLDSFQAEKKFVRRKAFTKIFGNHDLDWEINPLAANELKEIYGDSVIALEAVTLESKIGDHQLCIFCTHGHQGDEQSDGNYFSKFFISNIWAPLQAYLRINPNTPAYNATLKTRHNSLMYEWSSLQKDLLLITGHTHQPVFESLTHLERLQVRKNNNAYMNVKPTYFNTGCCCFDDGDITGIEIVDGAMNLIKWESKDNKAIRIELETTTLKAILEKLESTLT